MITSWEESRRRRKRKWLFFFPIAVCIGIGFLFISNNEERLFPNHPIKESFQKDSLVKAPTSAVSESTGKNVNTKGDTLQMGESPVRQKMPNNEGTGNKGDFNGKHTTLPDTSRNDRNITLELPAIECAVSDQKDYRLLIACKVVFSNTLVREEAAFKRDQLSVMVQKVCGRQSLSNLNIEMLRSRIKENINGVLQKGKAVDLEFVSFQPIKR